MHISCPRVLKLCLGGPSLLSDHLYICSKLLPSSSFGFLLQAIAGQWQEVKKLGKKLSSQELMKTVKMGSSYIFTKKH